MKKINMKKINEAGSLMVEAIAMLGLISLVTPVVYKKSAERMTELQDINAATQIRTLSKALDTYLQDQYDAIIKDPNRLHDTNTVTVGDLSGYLPGGMVEGEGDNAKVTGAFNNYEFSYTVNDTGIPGKPHYVLTGYVGAKGDETITPQRASRIATMVGSNGGYVEDDVAHGVNGIWETSRVNTGLSNEIKDTDTVTPIVATSQSAVSSAGAYVDTRKFLHREDEGDTELNTMETDIYMWGDEGSRSIQGINRLLVGYQSNVDGTKGAEDTGVSSAGYGLYLTSDKNTWLGGTLQAAQGKLFVDQGAMNFNPTTAEGVGSGSLSVNTGGMFYNSSAGDSLTVTPGSMEFKRGDDNKMITAFAGDAAAGVSPNVALVNGNLFVDGAQVIANQQLVANKQFVANASGGYDFAGNMSGAYTKVDGTAGTFNAAVGVNDTVLTGKTLATEIETGYLKTQDFDTLNFRAGRSNWDSTSGEGWNLEVSDSKVEIGNGGNAKISVSPLDTGSSQIYMETTQEDGNITVNAAGGGNVNLSSNNAGGIVIGKINEEGTSKGIIMGSKDDSVVELEKDIYVTSKNGDIVLARAGGKEGLVSGSDKTFNAATQGLAISDKNTTLQGADVYVNTNNTDGKGIVLVEDGILGVHSSISGEEIPYNAKGDDLTDNVSVLIRKGAIDITSDDHSSGKVKADTGTGYVKADRFVVEGTEGSLKDPRSVYKNGENTMNTGSGTQYDHYMVDPAYTSVMHDIKLTSRGGARLSDILPDFINKGIYVVDNSYGEDATKAEIIRYESGNTSSFPGKSQYASAWLGRVPAPQCPPGYAKVITVTPAGWRMAQIGKLVDHNNYNYEDDNHVTHSKGRLYLVEAIPTLEDTEEDKVSCEVDSAGVIKCPKDKVFQGSTWMKSAISPSYGESSETYDLGGGMYKQDGQSFKGWMVRMGYIYPENLWSGLLNKTGEQDKDEFMKISGESTSNKIYWNLFPVDKYSIEGYATVYCYFDREGLTNANSENKPVPYFNPALVDTKTRTSANSSVEQGSSKENNDYRNRLFNPNLEYDQEW